MQRIGRDLIPRSLGNGAFSDNTSRRQLNLLSFALSSFSCWSLPYRIFQFGVEKSHKYQMVIPFRMIKYIFCDDKTQTICQFSNEHQIGLPTAEQPMKM
jgi:hypothetical protein